MRVVPSPHVFAREFDGELVLLDLDGGLYFGLDGVGAAVWRALEQSGKIENAVDAVVSEFEVDEARARADILVLLAELEEKGIVRREG